MDLLEDAEPALAKAAALKPGELSYQYTLAVAKVGKRQFEAAQGLLEPLVQRAPGRRAAAVRARLGAVHAGPSGRGCRPSARERAAAARQLGSHYYLALVARDQGDDAEAIEQLEALLRRHPDHAASCEALGGLLMSAQRYDEAERICARRYG